MSHVRAGEHASFAQQGIWLNERTGPRGSAFHMPLAVWLDGELALPALRHACAAVVDRHPVLACAFAEVRGEPVPVAAAHRPAVVLADLSGCGPAEVDRFVREETVRRFDLASGPLCRFTVATLGPARHLLLFVAHHLVFDGISKDILVRDLAGYYAAEVAGSAPPPPLPVSFAESAAAERARVLAGLAEAREFWRDRWVEPAEVVLPGQARVPRAAAAGAVVELGLDAQPVAGLAAAVGATRFEVLLTAVHAVLYRYGVAEVAVAVDVNTRDPRAADLVGPFVNELPVITRPEPDATFGDFLHSVRGELRAAYRFRGTPLARAVGAVSPRAALTPVSMSYRRRGEEPIFPGLCSRVDWMVFNQGARNALHIQLVDGPAGLGMSLQYNPQAVDRDVVSSFAGHLGTLLGNATPAARVCDVDILAPDERRRVLVDWNDTAVRRPPRTLLDLFAERVRAHPEAVAVTFAGRELTYAQLAAAANRHAHHLRRLGVGPGHLVGVRLERSAAMLVGLLGVVKAGGAYLPLDPGYPPERLAMITEDAGVRHVIDRAEDHAGEPDSDPVPAPGPDDLAYVIYTSGSTGRPKGVEVTHRNLTNLLLAMAERLGSTGDDVWLALTSLSFDICALELFLPLVTGGRVVIAADGAERQPGAVARLVEEQSVTHVQATPSGWRLLLPGGVAGVTALAGGEALPRPLADELRRRQRRVFNVYGPTETTIWSTLAEPAGEVTIGRPIANTQVYVLDERMRPVPPGVAGELFIGGAGVARGYRGRPDLTGQRFITDPFGPPGSRLYRTGDRVRFRRDGELEFLGRLDSQVKVRGHRIEPAEIEARLLEHPDVEAAVVVPVTGQDTDGGVDTRLVGYLVVRSPVGAAALREHLGRALPPAMVPAAFVTLDRLPLTPNGKLDRAALPEPPPPDPRDTALEPPSAAGSPTVDEVRRIWQEVLNVEEIHLDDDLFELGGHSLSITQIGARIWERLGVDVPLDAFFDTPTIAGVVEEITRIQAEAAGGADGPRPRAAGVRPPLSFAQERLWFLQQFDPDDAAYNLFMVRRLRGALRVDALGAAVTAVVARHESLRTSYPSQDGEPVAIVHPPAPVPMERVEAATEDEARRLVAERTNSPFDLAGGPPLRVALVRLAPDDHVLCLVLHHIAGDGWSLNVLFDDVAAYYQGRAPDPLPVQFGDVALWQRTRSLAAAQSLEYWLRRLADPPVFDLPVDRPDRSGVGAFHQFRVPTQVAAACERIAADRGATLFMVLLAAYQTLLARHGGQADVLVGTQWAARNRVELERVVGYLVDTLILRGDLTGDPTFLELLDRTRQTVLDAHAHRDMPFERLINDLDLPRDIDRNPLLYTMLLLNSEQTDVATRTRFGDLAAELFDSGYRQAKFDLTLEVWRDGDGLALSFGYDTGLFTAATVADLADRFAVLLGSVAADPATRLAALPMLPAAEHRQVVHGWQGPRRHCPQGTVVDWFLRQAERSPDATAVVCAGEAVSYRELSAAAARTAHRLRAAGAGPGSLVAVCLDRSVDAVAAVLGVMMCGAGYLPVDPDHPAARIAYLLDDSGVSLVLTHRRLRDLLPARIAPLVLDDPGVPDGLPDPPAPACQPGGTAYVLYTSGSTGRPKGVVVPHSALANFLAAMADLLDAGAGHAWLGLTSLSFDISALEFYLPLVTGGRVVLADRHTMRDGVALADLVRRRGVTHVQATPTGWRMLLDGGLGAAAGGVVGLVGGEALPLPLAREVRAAVRRLVNVYGPTETTIWSTAWEVPPDPDTVLIGRPIANTTCYVLGSAGEPVPVGAPGELVIGGAGVATGYLGRPALTAERFPPDPYGPPGSRLYRTGDRVRRRRDGQLEFLGRIDNQLKIRGYRVEPGEIEARLLEHPEVAQAAVVADASGAGDPRLVAYVVGAADPARLGEYLAASLPYFMLPSAFVPMDALPLTPNGKLDRRALPAPAARSAPAGTPPRTATERRVAGVFGEVLGVERVGRGDDFFALGGHSLLATKVIARLGAPAGVRELFVHPTVEAFAAEVDRMRAQAGEVAGPVPRADGDNALSFGQERLWFLHRLDPDDASYNMFTVPRLRGRLDADGLCAAVAGVLARHESLRTSFPEVDGEPVTVVHPAGPPVERIEAATEDEARRLVAERTNAPFDLAAGPPVRVALIRLAPDDHVLCVVLHHIAGDGASLNILFDDLAAHYEGRAPDPLPVQFGDVAVWQRRRATERIDETLEFWRRELADPPPLELPADRARVGPARGESYALRVPQRTTAALEHVAGERGATLFMALLAAYQVFLSRHSGQTDVLVGTPWAVRDRAELERMVGYLTDTLVFRADLAGDPTFRDLLELTRRKVLAALEHPDVPFERLVTDFGLPRDAERNPLLPTMLILHSQATDGVARDRMGDAAVEPFDGGFGQVKFDLAVEAWRERDGLSVLFSYDAALFDAGTVAELGDRFAVLLTGVAAAPDTPVSALPLLTRSDEATLAGLAVTSDVPRQATVPELVAAAVARHPDATALRCGDRQLSYAELEAGTSALAAALRRRGVGPGDVVGVRLGRSIEAVVALLAVWRVRAAYLPMDPEYPEDRLAFLAADSGARLVLTEADLSGCPDETVQLPAVRPADAAYVIYTSGSTGVPKGVVVEHAALASRVHWMRAAYGLGPGDRVVQFASLSFDAHAEEIYPALAAGAEVLLLPDGAVSLPDVLRSPAGRGVTVLDLPTAYWHRMVDMLDELGLTACLDALRLLVLGGEQVHAAALARWRERFGDRVRVVNTYGPTEATIIATAADLGAGDTTGRPPIGRPVAGTTAYVLDEHGRPVPPGAPGELYLGGAGLARGYLGAPDLTEARFRPDPVGATASRWYRTGDRVRVRRDGMLQFLGRLDGQVKVRGFRVEPGEVEAALLAHPGVGQAAVVARDDTLVAYVVGRAGPEELQAHLAGALPAHLVPTAWVSVDSLPLTITGKVDTAALPAPVATPAAEPVPPRTDAEELVASVWAEVLGLEPGRVGALDDFFALGGHSLLATRVAARLRAAVDVEVPIRTVFDHPTVEGLAVAVEERLAAELSGLSDEEAAALLDPTGVSR
jgi:amino acid adenylation domain-containing protein